MGYNTFFNLDWEPRNQIIDKAIGDYIEANQDGLYGIDRDGYGIDWYKWYEEYRNPEMIALSNAFPHILFTLSGEGEERDDNWKMYIMNGKYLMSYGRIIYDEVNLDDLI